MFTGNLSAKKCPVTAYAMPGYKGSYHSKNSQA
jgi:hypothetical protein